MKYIISTCVAAMIAFFIWAQYGKESPANICTTDIVNGSYHGALWKDSAGQLCDPGFETTDALCEVDIKVQNNKVTEVDSSNGKQIWKNNISPARFSDGVARIITSNGKKFMVIRDWTENSVALPR